MSICAVLTWGCNHVLKNGNEPMKGKVAIITGAASGIGLAIAHRLLASDAIGHAVDLANECAEESLVSDPAFKFSYHTLDATDAAASVELIRRIYREHGQLEVLVA